MLTGTYDIGISNMPKTMGATMVLNPITIILTSAELCPTTIILFLISLCTHTHGHNRRADSIGDADELFNSY